MNHWNALVANPVFELERQSVRAKQIIAVKNAGDGVDAIPGYCISAIAQVPFVDVER